MNEQELNDDLNNQLAKLKIKESLSRVKVLSELEEIIKKHPNLGKEILVKNAEYYLKLVEGIHDILDKFDEQKSE